MNWQPYCLLLEKKGRRRPSYRPISNFHNSVTTISSQIRVLLAGNLSSQKLYPIHTQRTRVITEGRRDQQISKNQQNQRNQQTNLLQIIKFIIIKCFQLPPPGSSTKPASSFHHQAAAPHQPTSSKTTNQSALNSTTLPHPHHDSQVCCCLDIL